MERCCGFRAATTQRCMRSARPTVLCWPEYRLEKGPMDFASIRSPDGTRSDIRACFAELPRSRARRPAEL